MVACLARTALLATAASLLCGPVAAAQQPLQQTAGLLMPGDGTLAFTADYVNVAAFDRNPVTGALVFRGGGGHNSGGRSIEMTPDGRAIYAHSPDLSQISSTMIGEDGSLRPGPTTPSSAGAATGYDMAFARDGRSLFVGERGASTSTLAVYARDPGSGGLQRRGEVALDGGEGTTSPAARLSISPDERFLYASTGNRLQTFALDRGELPVPIDRGESIASSLAIAMAPRGDRLYGAGGGTITAFARDGSSGAITPLAGASFGGSGSEYGDRMDRSLLVSPQGDSVYAVDAHDDRVVQAAVTPEGLRPARIYRNFDGDTRGLDNPTALTISPDGRFVYVSAGAPPSQSAPSRVVVFRRDTSTGDLAFDHVFTGPTGAQLQPDACGLGCNGNEPQARVRINGGAAFTNSPDVVLEIKPGMVPSDLELSNDGGFLPLVRVPVRRNGRYPWRLLSSGPERLAKTVYVRHHDYGLTATDDIILDETVPTVVSAVLVPLSATSAAARAAGVSRRKVRLVARDRTSGVARVQSAVTRGRPGRWVRFERRATVPVGRSARWIRVADRAGNRSRWRKITSSR